MKLSEDLGKIILGSDWWQKSVEKVAKAQANCIVIPFALGTIEVDKEKWSEYQQWVEKVQLPDNKIGAIGGEFTHCVTMTSLGTVNVIKHSSGEKFDLTNYELW